MKAEQLTNGWKEVKLGSVAEFINGRAFKPSEWESEGKIIIRIQDLTGNIEKPNFTTKTFEDKYLVKKGDLLISWSATLDTFIWDGEEGWLNQHIFKVVENKNLIDKTFLYYLVKSKIEDFKKETHGSTMKHITKGDFNSIKFLLPPLPVQKQIVSILEKAEALKQKRGDADKLTKEYLQSVFYEMFGDPATNPKKWPIKKLGEISKEIQPGFAYGQFSNTEGLIHLRPFNISDEGFLILDQIKYIPVEIENSEKYLLSKGDILINTTNSKELVGKTAIFNLNKKYCFSNHMTKIRLHSSIADPYYIWYVLNNYWRSGVFKSIIKSWVNQVGIDSNLLKNNIEIPLPPLPLQQKFASIVDHVEKLKEKQLKSKEEINQLFDSLMQKAFNGELVK